MAISEGKYLSETNPAMSILRPLSPIAQTNSAGSYQMPLCMGWVGSSSLLEVASSDGYVASSDGSVVSSDGSVISSDGSVIPSEGSVIRSDGSVIRSEGSVISEAESTTLMGFSSGWVAGLLQTRVSSDASVISGVQDMMVGGSGRAKWKMEVCYVELYEGECKSNCVVLKNDDQIN